MAKQKTIVPPNPTWEVSASVGNQHPTLGAIPGIPKTRQMMKIQLSARSLISLLPPGGNDGPFSPGLVVSLNEGEGEGEGKGKGKGKVANFRLSGESKRKKVATNLP
jgi:hypothetical protein